MQISACKHGSFFTNGELRPGQFIRFLCLGNRERVSWNQVSCSSVQNVRTAPVVVREPSRIDPARPRPTLAYFADAEGIEEVVVLATCEPRRISDLGKRCRTSGELCLVFPIFSSDYSLAMRVGTVLPTTGRKYAACSAVASGLDSIVVGDPQIVHHLKKAGPAAQQSGSWGKCLTQSCKKRGQFLTESAPNRRSRKSSCTKNNGLVRASKRLE
jgi:hypothetical protein